MHVLRKRLIVLLFAGLLPLALTACDGEGDDAEQEEAGEEGDD